MISFITRRISNHSAKEMIFKHFFAGMREEYLQEMAEIFASKQLSKMLRTKAINCMRWHQEKGHVIIVASASLEIYLKPWGKMYAVNHILGTKLQAEGGVVTGRIDGNNCYGEEKVVRLRPLLTAGKVEEVYVYGDSRGDKNMLEIADYPFYKKWPKVIH